MMNLGLRSTAPAWTGDESETGSGLSPSLRAAIDASADAVLVLDLRRMRFVHTNDAAARLLGYARPEFSLLAPWDLGIYPQRELAAGIAKLTASRESGEAFDAKLQHKNGSKVPVQLLLYPLASASARCMICVATDLSNTKHAECALAQSHDLYRTLFDLNPLPMWVFDESTLAFLAVNQAAIKKYGFTRDEFLGMTIRDVRPAHENERLNEYLENRPTSGFREAGFWQHRRKDGTIFDVEVTTHAVDFEGRRARLVLNNDVTARLAAERALQGSNERFELVARATTDIVWDWDLASDERWWNENMTTLLGYDRAALAKGGAFWGVHPEDRERVQASVAAALESGATTWNEEYRFKHRDGHYLDIYDRACVMRNKQGAPLRMVGVMMDITERNRAARDLTHHLSHDQTTGLPRFSAAEAHLRSTLAIAAANDERVLVLYVDLDYFHAVNETRGRATGDLVLRTVAKRLKTWVGTSGKVVHIAGDEFAIVLLDGSRTAAALESGDRLRDAIAEPMQVAEENICVTCSIGIACFPDNATTPQELLVQAEEAVTRAKREGRDTVCVFSNEKSAELRVRHALGKQLRKALSTEQLLLSYQPQISGLNWQIRGFEALLRWQDPDLGIVPPKHIVQTAEELGLAVELERYVLHAACRQARLWIDDGAPAFSIAVNVSAIQLQRRSFVDDVGAALRKYNIPAAYVELELTESMMMENAERMIEKMKALKKLGVRLALDDFGTGYSSLNYLRQFPIDCLKIDQSFVREVTTDSGSAGICRSIIELGHQLGMLVAAEGVETAAQAGYLKRNNCDIFQGFYFSEALSPDGARALLKRGYLERDDPRPRETQTLLLVDDEANVLNALTRALRRDGYRILTALCAQDALNVLAREEVGVIVSDQRMSGMTGTELLCKVKDMHPRTVRMVLSGYSEIGVITEAINQGAVYKFLTKPWDDDDLRRQIQDAFRKYKAADTHDDAVRARPAA